MVKVNKNKNKNKNKNENNKTNKALVTQFTNRAMEILTNISKLNDAIYDGTTEPVEEFLAKVGESHLMDEGRTEKIETFDWIKDIGNLDFDSLDIKSSIISYITFILDRIIIPGTEESMDSKIKSYRLGLDSKKVGEALNSIFIRDNLLEWIKGINQLIGDFRNESINYNAEFKMDIFEQLTEGRIFHIKTKDGKDLIVDSERAREIYEDYLNNKRNTLMENYIMLCALLGYRCYKLLSKVTATGNIKETVVDASKYAIADVITAYLERLSKNDRLKNYAYSKLFDDWNTFSDNTRAVDPEEYELIQENIKESGDNLNSSATRIQIWNALIDKVVGGISHTIITGSIIKRKVKEKGGELTAEDAIKIMDRISDTEVASKTAQVIFRLLSEIKETKSGELDREELEYEAQQLIKRVKEIQQLRFPKKDIKTLIIKKRNYKTAE